MFALGQVVSVCGVAMSLAWNPIVFALGQVVISAVLNMESCIPEIQELLRKTGYPRFERLELQALRLEAGSTPRMHSETRWLFINRDRTGLVSINPNSIVLERSEYTSFDDFANELADVLGHVQEVIDVELIDRLGFRRVNLLEEHSNLPVAEALSPGLLGINAEAFTTGSEHKYEFLANTGEGRLIVRTSYPAPEGALPVDLSSGQLNIRKPTEAASAATVDIDHFMDEPLRGFVIEKAIRGIVLAEAPEVAAGRKGRQLAERFGRIESPAAAEQLEAITGRPFAEDQ